MFNINRNARNRDISMISASNATWVKNNEHHLPRPSFMAKVATGLADAWDHTPLGASRGDEVADGGAHGCPGWRALPLALLMAGFLTGWLLYGIVK